MEFMKALVGDHLGVEKSVAKLNNLTLKLLVTQCWSEWSLSGREKCRNISSNNFCAMVFAS